MRGASKVVGVQFPCLTHIYDEQVLKKASSIRADSSHPLNPEYRLLPSGQRLVAPVPKNNRYKFSFVQLIMEVGGGSLVATALTLDCLLSVSCGVYMFLFCMSNVFESSYLPAGT